MTKFKKCDYCKIENRTVKKYKSAYSKLGKASKTATIPEGIMIATVRPDVFDLCDTCFQDLIPSDKILRNNRIDNDFFEDELKQKLGKKTKISYSQYVRGNGVRIPRAEYVIGEEQDYK